ncbi:MAG TPA: hypothetical protein VI685_02300 [Candidatus Angelobacter sp.]
MKNTPQKLILSQETLRILVHEKPAKPGSNLITTHPLCPIGAGTNFGQR